MESMLEAAKPSRTALGVAIRRASHQLFFTPAEMAAELTAFQAVEDLGPTEINARYFARRTDELSLVGRGGHILSAWC
jgi:hypothetical protein